MKFKNIAVIPNEKKDPLLEHTKNLIDYLLKTVKGDINVLVNEIYKQKINNCVLKYTSEENLYETCDLLVTLGGDGTILRAAEKASRLGKPIIGVNLGRIGFMSEIEAHEISLLARLFAGEFRIEERMMIDVDIIKGSGIVHIGSALNDAIIKSGAIAKLIELDLFCDEVKITHCHADGVIIATPTGSTGYSMSAGGPIIDPNIACLCVTPICPHSLISRPIIFSQNSALEIRSGDNDNYNYNEDAEVYLTVDGRINQKLDRNDIVKITKSRFTAKLIRVKNHGFFDVIREKISEN